mmetsp:Transcript_50219/g.152137  ORF Transcript_50219/g.152137 Transcript_50219/m.152137 type:complete len:308 (+) Transcript_50219:1-924(+)
MAAAYSTVWLAGSGPFALPAEPAPALGAAGEAGLAARESLGFVEEPDAQWQLRKRIYAAQARLQAEHLGDCSDCNGHAFWQVHYEPSFSCAFERRVGPIGDGGKWLCDPHRIATDGARGPAPCLVYSVGSNGDYGFEQGIHSALPLDCEVHTIDVQPWQSYTNQTPPSYVKYHVYGVGQTPMAEIYRGLGHSGRVIDVLKIDCEGCEFATYKDWFSEDVFIRQILLEVHGPQGWGKSAKEVHALFRFLFSLGYVVFHKEPNTLANNFIEGGNCIEFALLRLSPAFASGAEPLPPAAVGGGFHASGRA